MPRLGGGCAFILIQGDRVIHRNAYGTFTPEKVVGIASSSKWISGGVIMALVDAGEISLDDRASKYLPYFTGQEGRNHHSPDVLAHARADKATPAIISTITSLTMDEAVRKIAQCDLIADPGTALYYGGMGMQAAGRICEIATGKPWAEIFRETLGDPLEMDSTDYFGLGGPTKNPNVAGAVRTCVDDYGNYLTMLLNRGVYKGKRILVREGRDHHAVESKREPPHPSARLRRPRRHRPGARQGALRHRLLAGRFRSGNR